MIRPLWHIFVELQYYQQKYEYDIINGGVFHLVAWHYNFRERVRE